MAEKTGAVWGDKALRELRSDGKEIYEKVYKPIEGETCVTVYLEGKQAQDGEESPYATCGSLNEIAAKKLEYKRKGEAPPPTAYEKMLWHADIDPKRDKLEKFFAQTSDVVLFPEFIAAGVTEGFIENSLLGVLAATVSEVEFGEETVRRIILGDEGVDQEKIQLRHVTQGAEIPETMLGVTSQTITLLKHGRGLIQTYEYTKNLRINEAQIALRRIGERVGVDETDDMIGVAINGDGNSNPATIVVQPAVSGSIDMDDIVEVTDVFSGARTVSDIIMRKALALTYRQKLANFGGEFGTARAGEAGFGLPRMHRWDRTIVPADQALVLDARNALAAYQSNVLTEADALISRQVRRTYVTKYSGQQKLDPDAVALWDTIYT
jgi:hypothetical protein